MPDPTLTRVLPGPFFTAARRALPALAAPLLLALPAQAQADGDAADSSPAAAPPRPPSPTISAAVINLLDALAERLRGETGPPAGFVPDEGRDEGNEEDEVPATGPPGATTGGEPRPEPSDNPALDLEPEDLEDFDSLPPSRQAVVRRALELVRRHGGLPYTYGGESAAEGGFDCSGFIHQLLGGLNRPLDPPRSAAAQFAWIEVADRLHPRTEPIRDLDDPFFADLRPGDLLFWSGTYRPSEERPNDITHVAVFLGHEKDGHRPVMANSSTGRSYRGERQRGLSVVDFSLPREGATSRFRGYGTPPGLQD